MTTQFQPLWDPCLTFFFSEHWSFLAAARACRREAALLGTSGHHISFFRILSLQFKKSTSFAPRNLLLEYLCQDVFLWLFFLAASCLICLHRPLPPIPELPMWISTGFQKAISDCELPLNSHWKPPHANELLLFLRFRLRSFSCCYLAFGSHQGRYFGDRSHASHARAEDLHGCVEVANLRSLSRQGQVASD